MKVLITGGAGYIGYSLTQHIAQSYNEVSEIVIYDNLSRKNYAFFMSDQLGSKPIRFVKGDILDGRTLRRAMEGAQVVVHLAAKVTTPFADNEAHFYDQINNWGTAQVVQAAEEAHVQHFIYLSSASVYGHAQEVFSEADTPFPQSFYGISKYEGERQVERLMPKMRVHILRSANVFGYNPAMRMDSVINQFMFDANFNGRITIHGSGEQRRPFIHVDKLAFVVKELLRREIAPGTYNVAEHNYSINEIAESVQRLYPGLESIGINHNMKMSALQLALPCALQGHLPLPERSLMDELHDFKVHFSF